MKAYTWHPQRLKMLKELWADGYSASEIGSRLAVTRNAVLGKIHRIGLSQKRNDKPAAGSYAGRRRGIVDNLFMDKKWPKYD